MNMYHFFIPLLLILGMLPVNVQAQCLEWQSPSPTTGWNDFTVFFGGAPCDDGSGCPFLEIENFEVLAAEAYVLENVAEGGTYAFSMCNGPGAGSWTPEFTIIAPSGAVDAFGAGDGDGCTITWTASEAGIYLIVINEAGECGGGPNTGTNNGYPAITCISGAPCDPMEDACNAGELATTGEVTVCGPDNTFDLLAEMDTVPTGGGYGWWFSDQLGGTGALPGTFILSNSVPEIKFDSDLNGVLSANSLDRLDGTWVIKGAVYEDDADAFGTICNLTADSLIVVFVAESPAIDNIEDNGDGSATVTVSGGLPPYSYAWSDPASQSTATASGLEPGDYTVTVTDENGCEVTATVEVISTDAREIDILRSLVISPNPTHGKFFVEIKLHAAETVQMDILDATGRMLESRKMMTPDDKIEFNLSDQPAGLYWLKLTIGDQSIARRFLLVD